MNTLALWWLMSLAAYRLTRLVVKDTFPPALWVRDRLAGGWRDLTDADWRAIRQPDKPVLEKDPVPFQVRDVKGKTVRWVERAKWSPDWLAELITCPWCASAYISACVITATDLTVGVRWPWLVGFAVWGAAGILASREWL